MRLTRSLTLIKLPIEAWGYKQARLCPLRRSDYANDQVVCCCRLCLGRRDIGGSNDSRADSSAGRDDDTSGLRLRSG
jgi:hypothetical protein